MLILGMLIGLVAVLLLVKLRRKSSARHSKQTPATPGVSGLPQLALNQWRERQDPKDKLPERGF